MLVTVLKHRTLHVILPENWHESDSHEQGGGRIYCPNNDNPGRLRISLLPPDESHNKNPLIALSGILENTKMPVGEQLAASISQGRAGSIATILRQIPDIGLVQFWLIPSEMTVFMSFEMGDPGRASKGFEEAGEIVSGLEFIGGSGLEFLTGKQVDRTESDKMKTLSRTATGVWSGFIITVVVRFISGMVLGGIASIVYDYRGILSELSQDALWSVVMRLAVWGIVGGVICVLTTPSYTWPWRRGR